MENLDGRNNFIDLWVICQYSKNGNKNQYVGDSREK
jgi:hypothetical protein